MVVTMIQYKDVCKELKKGRRASGLPPCYVTRVVVVRMVRVMW